MTALVSLEEHVIELKRTPFSLERDWKQGGKLKGVQDVGEVMLNSVCVCALCLFSFLQ